jgi:hypothetical protein
VWPHVDRNRIRRPTAVASAAIRTRAATACRERCLAKHRLRARAATAHRQDTADHRPHLGRRRTSNATRRRRQQDPHRARNRADLVHHPAVVTAAAISVRAVVSRRAARQSLVAAAEGAKLQIADCGLTECRFEIDGVPIVD